MNAITEVAKFIDGRLMVRVRFSKNSNFRFEDIEEATWVPTLEEVDHLKEVLDVIDSYNRSEKRNI